MPNKAELLAGLIDANGDVLADNLDNVSVAFADVTSKPTTLAGYGITDAASDTELSTAVANSANWDTAFGWGNHATQGYATTTYVDTSVSNLVAAAPTTLDTLNELAAALGDDPNFATTVTNSIATKAPLANPTFTTGIDVTGTVTADGLTVDVPSGSGSIDFNVGNGNQASFLFKEANINKWNVASVGSDDRFQIYNYNINGFAQTIAANNDISFYEATGTTPKLFWDASAESLGIGTSSPNAKLMVSYGNNAPNASGNMTNGSVFSNSGTLSALQIGSTSSYSYLNSAYSNNSGVGVDLRIYTGGGTERFRMETDGDFHADGDVIAYSTTISDERLKTNIQGIENAVAKVSQLNGYTFEYKADGKVSAGVIAQEVESVLPEAVSEKQLPLKTDDGQEYKVVNYDALHGLLIEAIKELAERVEALEAK